MALARMMLTVVDLTANKADANFIFQPDFACFSSAYNSIIIIAAYLYNSLLNPWCFETLRKVTVSFQYICGTADVTRISRMTLVFSIDV